MIQGGAPRISVIVPTFDRPAAIEVCLRALAAQDCTRSIFEVLVVDDGSDNPPREVVRRYSDSLSLRLIEHRPRGGPARARNRGAEAARGSLLVFTDDDCVPSPSWLSAIDEAATSNPGAAIGGRVINAMVNDRYSHASQLLTEFLYEYYNDPADGGARFFLTSNIAFPAPGFRELGGFDSSFPLAAAEDRDMCDRWRERGYEMVFAAEAVVEHAHGLTLARYCRQHFNYGRGAWFLRRARSRRGQPQLRVEPLAFYWRLVTFPFGGEGQAPLLTSALLALSQLSYIAGYFWQRTARPTSGVPTPGV